MSGYRQLSSCSQERSVGLNNAFHGETYYLKLIIHFNVNCNSIYFLRKYVTIYEAQTT